jgi:hypothetical protein
MLVYLHKLLKTATSAEYWLLSMIPWNRPNKDEMVPKVNRVNIRGRVHRLLVRRAEEPCDQINANDFGGDFGNQEKNGIACGVMESSSAGQGKWRRQSERRTPNVEGELGIEGSLPFARNPNIEHRRR